MMNFEVLLKGYHKGNHTHNHMLVHQHAHTHTLKTTDNVQSSRDLASH